MGIIKKSITVTEELDAWVKAQVQSGKFGNDSEVYRAAVRQAQSEAEKLDGLRREIQMGRDSGVGRRSMSEIKADALKHLAVQDGV